MARYEYRHGHDLECEPIDKVSSYDELTEEINEINNKVAHEATISGCSLSFDKDRNKEPNCLYTQVKSTVEDTGLFTLKVNQDTKSIFELQGYGTIKSGKKSIQVDVTFSILDWNDNKINCTYLTITNAEGGIDNSFKYIFPTTDGVEHTIDCYCNLLPIDNH